MNTKRYCDLKPGDHIRLPKTEEFEAMDCRVEELQLLLGTFRGFLYVTWDDSGQPGEVPLENCDASVEVLP